jgi:hypothetical protein
MERSQLISMFALFKGVGPKEVWEKVHPKILREEDLWFQRGFNSP